MSLGNWLADQIISENTNIKTVVAIYPGRFQPKGAHHAKTFKWLQSKFKDAYVGTSDKVDLPKSPFSFAEKKKIINSHGIKSVVKIKNPYKAEEILKTKARINKIISEETGRPLEQVEKDTDRDYWMSVKEAIEYGIVSKEITSIGDIT